MSLLCLLVACSCSLHVEKRWYVSIRIRNGTRGVRSRLEFEGNIRRTLGGGQEGGLADLTLNVHGLLVLQRRNSSVSNGITLAPGRYLE